MGKLLSGFRKNSYNSCRLCFLYVVFAICAMPHFIIPPCGNNYISCLKIAYLLPVFGHFNSDILSDQSSTS
jgi:hypothetical protein